jgi:hypothetical protein
MKVLSDRLHQLKTDFASNPEDAMALLAVGQSKVGTTIDPIEHAAYAVVCSILLNLDETLSRQ